MTVLPCTLHGALMKQVTVELLQLLFPDIPDDLTLCLGARRLLRRSKAEAIKAGKPLS